jgi:uncharacterized membrane protein
VIFRIGSAVGALAFAWFATLQRNDPDPAPWIAIYAGSSLISLIGALRRTPLLLAAGMALVAFGWAASLVPEVISQAAWTGTEVERELGGLVLIGAWMLALGSEGRRSR